MEVDGSATPEAGERAPASRELRVLRENLWALFSGAAFAVLGTLHLAGLLGRAPVVASGLMLLAALTASAFQSAAALVRRLVWRIWRKLLLSYVFIAFVPLLLVTIAFLVLGYAASSQLLAYVTWRHIGELLREVEQVGYSTGTRIADQVSMAPDLAAARQALEAAGEVPPELDGLRARFPGAAASAAVFGPDGAAYVPSGLEWPAGVKAQRPAWLADRRFEAGFVIGRGGALELRTAGTRDAGPYQVYVEVGVPLDGSALEALRRSIGMDLRVVEQTGRGDALEVLAATSGQDGPGRGRLGALPIFGVFFVSPIRWENGETLREGRLLVTQRSLAGLYRELRDFRPENRVLFVSLLVVVLVAFLVMEAASLALGVTLARSITGSIHEIFGGTQRIERGDLSHRIPVRSHDQFGALAGSFNQMAGSIERLVRESAERERLEEELRIGRRIQQSLLPRQGIRHDRFEIAAVSFPAREVGGDYYDYFDLGGDRLGLLIADVSGKGTEAAFYMAEVKGIMLALSRLHDRPIDVLAEANQLLAESLDRRTFVTMTYGVLRSKTSDFVFARAGHSPVLYLGRGEPEVRSIRTPGLALGIDRKGQFRGTMEEGTLELAAGDLVLLYTDGVTDTVAPDGEFYGEERLHRALVASRDRDAEAIRDALVAELRRFGEAGLPRDDLTLIAIRVR